MNDFRYQFLSKRPIPAPEPNLAEYKSLSSPITAEEIPVKIKFNKELLEKKNMYSEFKRIEPPRQLVGRLVEMKRNEKLTLEKRPQIFFEDEKPPKKRTVYDSVFQDPQF